MFTYLLSLYRVGIVLSIYANFHSYYGPVIGISDRLPEACLQTCSVNVVLLVMCIPVFIVTSAIFMLYCLRLVVVMFMERV